MHLLASLQKLWAGNLRRDVCAPRQVHQGRTQEIWYGQGQASLDAHVDHDGLGCRWRSRSCGPEGVPKHDRVATYLTATRPDIQFTVCLCARFQASPRTSHRQAVKRILRYLRFTPEFGLWFSASSYLFLCGYSDVNYAGCRVEHKSTSGTCQFLGTYLVSWSSCKQFLVAQSTTEAEYVAAAACCS